MTHLAATISPAPQASDQPAPDPTVLRSRYLQRSVIQIERPVYRKSYKNFLENLNKVFHYSVIGGDAAAWPAVATPACFPLLEDTASLDARMTLPNAAAAPAGSLTSHSGPSNK